MAKIRKVRISATIPPRQREYLGKLADERELSVAEILEELLDEAIQARFEAAEVGA